PAARALRASSATARTGVATKVIVASGSSPTASRAPSSSARWARAGSRSRPVTYQPSRRSRMPIDPPISPVPTITARPGVGGCPRTTSGGEVVAQVAGALEVDVVQLAAGPVGVQVDEHSDAAGRPALDVELARADERHVAEAELAGGLGREGRVDVVGGGEQHADEVVVPDPVALEERFEQGDHPLEQVVLLVDVDGGGAAQRPDDGGHDASRLAACGARATTRRPAAPAAPAPAGGPRPRRRGPLERPHLLLGQVPPPPRGQPPVGEGTDADPHEAPDRVPDGLAHAPHLAVAPLVDGDAQQVVAHERHRGRGRRPVVQLDALPQPPQRPPGRRPRHLGQVLLLDAVGRVGQPVREVAVVGEQAEPLGGAVESAHRVAAGPAGHEVDDGRPPLRVRGGRDHTPRLVEQVVDEALAGADADAVDLDDVRVGVGTVAEDGHLAVDPDPAGRDELLAGPPAADAGPGEDLLQPLALGAHASVAPGPPAPRPSPAGPSPSGSPNADGSGTVDRSGRSPRSSCSTTSASGTKSPSGGSSSSESIPSASRNRGVVPYMIACPGPGSRPTSVMYP